MMDEELRLKALTAAQAEGLAGKDAQARAEEIYQWLRYGADGATETRMALDGVTLTDARTGKTRPARVIGQDNDILDRLRKGDGYKKD